MAMFSSREPFNDDPEPYQSTLGKGRFRMNVGYCVRKPRPEYDRPQNNPTNPILVYARKFPDSNILWSYLPFRPTDDMIAHARKVLSRRSNLRIQAEVDRLFN